MDISFYSFRILIVVFYRSFSISIAKYCAKKLSRECWVVAIDNGKIVFQREPVIHSSCRIKGSPSFIKTIIWYVLDIGLFTA